jgi:(p)ppGpp synthase/HD superfamily hydrolase
MDIKDKALRFAIEAHKGQVRKSFPDKPMIMHPIDAGGIAKEYGMDDNVVAE